jgi:hypothetical protein
MLSLLFWIPLFAKKRVISLLHSLPFFIYIIKDAFQFHASTSGREMIRNEIRIYSDSLLLNITTLVIVILLTLLVKATRNNKLPH